MKVSELMTNDVATCAPGDSLGRAAQLMWEHRCGCLPVLDDERRVLGLVTDRDVCMAAYTQGRRLDDITVGTAMSSPAFVCTAVANVEDAEDAMMAHAIRRLVVVDQAGRLRGLVSLDDVARRSAAWDGGGDVDAERVALTLGEIARRTTAGEEPFPEDAALAGIEAAEASAVVASSLAALATLRDEIRVDLNLAGKEVRDRWRRLETRLRAAETRARQTQRGGASSLAGLLESAREFRSRFLAKRATRRRASPRAKPARAKSPTRSRAR